MPDCRPPTLIRLLHEAAEACPDQALVLATTGTLTYADAHIRSEELARGLDRRGLHRLGCQLSQPADVLVLLCAASAVGSEVCVYPGYLDESGVAELAHAFDHPVVVTDRHEALADAATVALDDLSDRSGRELREPPPIAPVLILTSGTSGQPKGVRHEWSRLAAGVRQRGPEPGARWLLAYNLNQFAGIQMLLHVLATRATLVIPASGQPAAAAAAMERFSVTRASATPTFWRFLCAQLDERSAAQLSLRQITLGGEAVSEQVLADLRRLFPEARISHVYAATEFGSTVSVRDGRAGLPLSVLERGPDTPVRFKIVADELHTRSTVGMLGYYGAEGVTDGEWRPTGDLVEIRGDRIHFVGRTNETINVGGAKVHPLPIEEIVSSVEGVKIAHSYGRRNPITGQVVAVDVAADEGVDEERLRTEIRAACANLPAAARPRLIRVVPELKVLDHKLSRRSPAVDDRR